MKTLPTEIKIKFSRAISRGYLDGYNPSWSRTFIGAFLTKYPDRTKVLKYLEESLGHRPKWSDFTDWNLQDFVNMLKENMCLSSVRTNCFMLKSVINFSIKSGEVEIPSKNFSSILSVKKEPSQAVYLTEDEINKIDTYKPATKKEQYVKKIFMIEALTGARHSDAENLSMANVDKDRNMIKYVPIKTKIVIIELPVHKMLPKYLEMDIDPIPDLGTFNKTLREICHKCGITEEVALFRQGKNSHAPKWQYVSSHTGRRSFATNLYLRDVDVDTIQRFMGHSSPNMTRGYICASKAISEKAMSFFN